LPGHSNQQLHRRPGHEPLVHPPLSRRPNWKHLYEAAGDPEEYYLNVIEDHDPRTDAIHWRSIEVCDGISTIDMALMDEELRKVAVDNESYNFNCQVWVFEALEVLFDMELIPSYEYHEAYEKLMALHYDTHGEGQSEPDEE
jgi:uncharacterized Zn finger protein